MREAKARLLQDALVQQKDRQLCVICQDAVKSVLLLPCRHLCSCMACYSKLVARGNALCPVCRAPIASSLDVYS